MRAKTGFQIQRLTGAADDPALSMVRATLPHCLKLYRGSASLALVTEWSQRRPDGVLVLRTVGTDTEPLGTVAQMARDDVSWWGAFRRAHTGPVVLEVRINERFHTSLTDFANLALATDAAVDVIAAAGFWPGVLVTSEGNPPGDGYGADYFLQPAVLRFLQRWRTEVPRRYPGARVIWCPHGYSHPPDPSDDPYHSTRPRHILAQLPTDARLNYLYGEDGCDGGTAQLGQRPGQGWRSYFPDARAYATWYEAKRAAIAADPLCIGSAIFLCGADPASVPSWASFDLGDEVDLRRLFTEDVPGPAVTWLDPVAPSPAPVPQPSPGGVPVPDVVLSVPERHSHAIDGNYEPTGFGPCVGVVIHSTAGVSGTLENEYIGTINWFQDQNAEVSADRVIGAGKFAEVNTSVHDGEKAYHAREPANTNRRGIEFAHPDTDAWNAQPYPDFQYEAAGELIARWKVADDARGWRWPIRLLTRAELTANPSAPGICYHRDLPAGIADGKRDPTGPFDGVKLIAAATRWYAKLTGPTPIPVPPTPTPGPEPQPIPPQPGHWPNGRVIASNADYEAHCWALIYAAALALRAGGNGSLGDDADALALEQILTRSKRAHGAQP